MLAFLLLAFIFLVVLFAVQNTTPVAIRFLSWQFSPVPLSLVLVGALFAGALLFFFLNLGRQARLKQKLKTCTQENESLRSALARLQNENLEDTQPFPPLD